MIKRLSETGLVIFFKKGITISPKTDYDGYKLVGLHLNNKQKMFRVHRLVAIHFIPNPKNKKQVNHIDCNKTNNTIENLEWVTSKENMVHANKNGLIKRNFGIYNHSSKNYIGKQA